MSCGQKRMYEDMEDEERARRQRASERMASVLDLTDEECLAAWSAATRTGAGGPSGEADRAAVALVRLMLAPISDEPWSTPLWLCSGLGIGGNSADEGPKAVRETVKNVRVAARVVVRARGNDRLVRAARAVVKNYKSYEGLYQGWKAIPLEDILNLEAALKEMEDRP